MTKSTNKTSNKKINMTKRFSALSKKRQSTFIKFMCDEFNMTRRDVRGYIVDMTCDEFNAHLEACEHGYM